MRDWKNFPPKTFEDSKQFARDMAQSACNHAFEVTGERPRVVERGNKFLIVWPDGLISNEIEVSEIAGRN